MHDQRVLPMHHSNASETTQGPMGPEYNLLHTTSGAAWSSF
jgi:hypothetical protein